MLRRIFSFALAQFCAKPAPIALVLEEHGLSATTHAKGSNPQSIRARKGGVPLVCLTAYTTPVARLVDPHCDLVLVGDSVGLHPVWLIFALLAFGYLLGFVGLLVAVPLAATIGVLARFALRRYLDSSLYTGTRAE